MVRCILFDNDGVVNARTEFFSVWYSREFHVPHERMEPFFAGPFQLCSIGKADLKEELSRVLLSWDWAGSVDDFLSLWFQKEVVIDTHILELVLQLKKQGVVCCMITDHETHRLKFLRETVFKGTFDHIYCSAEIGRKKSDPDFFAYVKADVEGRFHSTDILAIDDEEQNIVSASKHVLAYQYISYPSLLQLLRRQGFSV
jgi:FMN phosphatase YigB (HAD superfamily)